MSLIQRVRSVLGRDASGRSYSYQCRTCDEQFVTEESHMARVSCPGCGSNDVRSVAGET